MGSTEPFERFRSLVLADPELEARLRSIPDWPSFLEAAIEAAAESGLPLTDADILAARDGARRSWRERWI